MRFAHEQMFVPVLATMTFRDLDEAMRTGNDAFDQHTELKTSWIDLA